MVKKQVTTKIDKQGRLVVPAEIREELGVMPETTILMQVVDGVLQVETVRHALDRHLEMVRSLLPDLQGRSIVDEFIAERRAEAARE